MFKPHLRCTTVVERVHQITSRGPVLLHQCVFIPVCRSGGGKNVQDESGGLYSAGPEVAMTWPQWSPWAMLLCATESPLLGNPPQGGISLLSWLWVALQFLYLHIYKIILCGSFLGSLFTLTRVVLSCCWISHFQVCVSLCMNINAVYFWTKEQT